MSVTDIASDFIILHQHDNVATARRTLKKGASVVVGDSRVKLRQTIPGGHKVALLSINPGEQLVKYGQYRKSVAEGKGVKLGGPPSI